MGQIRHVYFDVGGVTLLDYSGTDKWIEMKRALGVTKDQDIVFDAVWKKHRDRICIDCDVDTIVKDFEFALATKLPENYSMLEDFTNRFEQNDSIWPIVRATKEKYSVGLLTNMYPRMLSSIQAKKLLPDIEWDVIVDSSVVGYQKPNEAIYGVAEQMVHVEPESIFFIDNSSEHLETARKRGWQTLLYNPQDPATSNQEIVKLLKLVI